MQKSQGRTPDVSRSKQLESGVTLYVLGAGGSGWRYVLRSLSVAGPRFQFSSFCTVLLMFQYREKILSFEVESFVTCMMPVLFASCLLVLDSVHVPLIRGCQIENIRDMGVSLERSVESTDVGSAIT